MDHSRRNDNMIKYLIILMLIFSGVAISQEQVEPHEEYHFVEVDLSGSSPYLLFTLPPRSIVEHMYMVIDTALTYDASDSILIGPDAGSSISLFGRFKISELDSNGVYELNHYSTRPEGRSGGYLYENTENISIASAGTYYPITSFESNTTLNTIPMINGVITIPNNYAGIYTVGINLSFKTDNPNIEIHGVVLKNNVIYEPITFQASVPSPNVMIIGTSFNDMDLAVGDSLKFAVSGDNNTTLDILHGQFYLRRSCLPLKYKTGKNTQEIYLYSAANAGRVRIFIKYRKLY